MQLLQRRSTRRVRLHHSDKSPRCKTHGQPLEMYCKDCNEAVCLKCAGMGHRNHTHGTLPELEDLLKEKATALSKLIQPGCEVRE